MTVKNIMTPAAHVVTCFPSSTIEKALDLILANPEKGAVVVILPEKEEIPVGIVTKTDLIRGWEKGLDAKTHTVAEVMGTSIETILDTSPTGVAAEHFEKKKHRHAFVVDKDGKYVGIVTAYDIAVETARDNKAWPYVNRDALAEKYRVPTHAH